MKSPTGLHWAIALMLTLVAAGTVLASGAGFVVRGLDIDLGKAEELQENGQPLPPRYNIKVEKGKEFTLCAQGMIYPRGAKESPGEPECAAWLFDDAAFKLRPNDPKQADKSKTVIRLQAMAPGKSRIRFVGEILGYAQKVDVYVQVVEK